MIFQPSMKQAVGEIIDSMPVGTEFYGNQLKDWVVAKLPDKAFCYTDTVLRTLRKVRRENVKCIDVKHSKYRKIGEI